MNQTMIFTGFAQPLTKPELELILEQETAADLLVAFYDTALAYVGSSYEQETAINPTQFKIPEDQWRTICKVMTDKFGGGMTWVNIGPSAIQEDMQS